MANEESRQRTIDMLTRCMQTSHDGREYNSRPDEFCERMQDQQVLPPEPTGNGETCDSTLGQEIFNPPLATPTLWFGYVWPPVV